jgi:predicted O-methyltransferase YrrM
VTATGTAAYDAWGEKPPTVAAAVDLARGMGFDRSCRPEQGELLRILARGIGAGTIGETGTGCGVGLAWLASAAHPDARIISIDRDAKRAAAVGRLVRDDPRVRVCHGDWSELVNHGPFDLLVLDGGGHGKGTEPPLDPAAWVRPGGLIVIDDFTPSAGWPPMYGDEVDTTRLYWLEHPALRATQIGLAHNATTVVAAVITTGGRRDHQ